MVVAEAGAVLFGGVKLIFVIASEAKQSTFLNEPNCFVAMTWRHYLMICSLICDEKEILAARYRTVRERLLTAVGLFHDVISHQIKQLADFQTRRC